MSSNDDQLFAAARVALNYIENTESELGITLQCGDALRAAIASRGQVIKNDNPTTAAARAYGLLWLYEGTDWAVHKARRLLLDGLTKDEQKRGISFAQFEVMERQGPDTSPVPSPHSTSSGEA